MIFHNINMNFERKKIVSRENSYTDTVSSKVYGTKILALTILTVILDQKDGRTFFKYFHRVILNDALN